MHMLLKVIVFPQSFVVDIVYPIIAHVAIVGYGDLYPTSIAGRAVANASMYFGVLLLALPIGVISNNFAILYDQFAEVVR